MDFYKYLDSQQQELLKQIDGPILVNAGAGTGKTTALTYRISYMISQKINPYNLLAVTFTNKAAKEMQERTFALLDKNFSQFLVKPKIGTFHSICAQILRSEIKVLGRDSSFLIFDQKDQLSAIKEILKNNPPLKEDLSPQTLLFYFDKIKRDFVLSKNLKSSSFYEEELNKYYKLYEKFLEKNNVLDFNDLILKTVLIFKNNPEILEKHQNRFLYLAVDEYQDTNEIQYQLIKLLAEKNKNICVIGDPDQSIYAFRGAKISNILNFTKDFPKTKIINLTNNYRSTPQILKQANLVIKNNQNRLEKELQTLNKDGEEVVLNNFFTDYEEAENIIKEIKNSLPLKENVILYRTNAQSRIFEEVLLKYKIPYLIVGGVKFYARKEIKDILAYLRIIYQKNDEVSLLRIINFPKRGIGKTSLNKLRAEALHKNLSVFELIEHIKMCDLPEKTKILFLKFKNLYDDLKKDLENLEFSEFVKKLLEKTGYNKILNENDPKNEERKENISELINIASRYNQFKKDALAYFLEEISLLQDTDSLEKKDSVYLMTIHSAKGLEFDNVYLTGLEEGLFPSDRSLEEEEQIEEERRLFYVALTRAKKKLSLSYVYSRQVYGRQTYKIPSRFIDELSLNNNQNFKNINEKESYLFDEDSQVINSYPQGTRVYHPFYGEGIVLKQETVKVTVKFLDGNIKTFALTIVPLQILD
jgi:DNA helicase-2/ATP-dependent DNA helicase PcrA